ncbi:MAG: DUF1722 domain-containing protein [Gammaproteobacteria bacterium]|nr:DUF1722 domain-containing protein [Gammaproteobacteria bacterium]
MGNKRIRIAISSCLLGERVRYDGNHKRDAYINDVLSQHFEFVPFCPEMAIGLGVPRATLRLRLSSHGVRAVQSDRGGHDVTRALAAYGRRVAGSDTGISGYIFKARSPSCGPARVKVYDFNGSPSGTAMGIYASAIMETLPLLPVEDEGRLNDPDLRDSFIERVWVCHCWHQLLEKGMTAAALLKFHTEHKFLIPAHSRTALRVLGQITAGLNHDVNMAADHYVQRLMQALSRPARRVNQANVLQQVAGFFQGALNASDRKELHDAIDSFGKADLPIIVPLTLIRHHLRQNPHAWREGQRFLESRPRATGTRRR